MTAGHVMLQPAPVKAHIPLCRLPRVVRDIPVTSPFAQIPLRRLPRNFPGRGSFGEVGIVEFGLYAVAETMYYDSVYGPRLGGDGRRLRWRPAFCDHHRGPVARESVRACKHPGSETSNQGRRRRRRTYVDC